MRLPIRLMVTYHGTEALIREFTRSISFGGLDFSSSKELEPDTEFVFSMSAPGITQPLEVTGTVVHSSRQEDGSWKVGVRYSFDDQYNRQTLQKLVDSINEAYRWDYIRQEPRLPVKVRVRLAWEDEPRLLLKDISRGGAQLALVHGPEPEAIVVGARIALNLPAPPAGSCLVNAEVVWLRHMHTVASPEPEMRFGLRFVDLCQAGKQALERFVSIEQVPELVVLSLLDAV